ncbi:MAG: hypothetical protein AAF770_00205 [Bacteroidota bacterium]
MKKINLYFLILIAGSLSALPANKHTYNQGYNKSYKRLKKGKQQLSRKQQKSILAGMICGVGVFCIFFITKNNREATPTIASDLWYSQDVSFLKEKTKYNRIKRSPHITPEELEDFKSKMGNPQVEAKWWQDIIQAKEVKFDLPQTGSVMLTANACQTQLNGSILDMADSFIEHMRINDAYTFTLEKDLYNALKKFKEIAENFDRIKDKRVIVSETRLVFAGDYHTDYSIDRLMSCTNNSDLIQLKIDAMMNPILGPQYSKLQIKATFLMMIKNLQDYLNTLETNIRFATRANDQKNIQEKLDRISLACDLFVRIIIGSGCFANTLQSINAIFQLVGSEVQRSPVSLHGMVYQAVEKLREEAFTRTCAVLYGGEVHNSNRAAFHLADTFKLQGRNITQEVELTILEINKRRVKREFLKHFNAKKLIKTIGQYMQESKRIGNIQLNIDEYRAYCIKRLQDAGYNPEEEQYAPYILDDSDTNHIVLKFNWRVLIAYLIDIGILRSVD